MALKVSGARYLRALLTEMVEPPQNFVSCGLRCFEGIQVGAVNPAEVRSDKLAHAAQSAAAQFSGVGACDERQRAVMRVARKLRQQAMGQGAVDGGFDVTAISQVVA